jgi:hypothetical protein
MKRGGESNEELSSLSSLSGAKGKALGAELADSHFIGYCICCWLFIGNPSEGYAKGAKATPCRNDWATKAKASITRH